MPFVSLAQEGWAHEHPDKFGRSNLKEFDAATKGKHLPERVHHEEKHSMKSEHDGLGHEEHKSEHRGPHHTHIEHHHDGSKTVHHYHHPVPVPPKEEGDHSHAVADLDALHDNLEEHLGEPNGDEGQEGEENVPQQ